MLGTIRKRFGHVSTVLASEGRRCLSVSCSRPAEKAPFRILFCGSDSFSVASLKAVHEAQDIWSSIDVVVPAEREIGRGGKNKHLQKYIPALRLYAEQHGLPTYPLPPTGIKDWSPPSTFSTSSPQKDSHILLTASFGHIIPNRLLNMFLPTQRLNVHPSLLPRWRGAAPVQWTLASGDRSTGVSVQTLVRYGLGVDAGDIVGRVDGVEVSQDANYETLLPYLADIGGKLLVDVLRDIRDGKACYTPQDEQYIVHAPKITLESAQIRWGEQPAIAIDRLHRAISHQTPIWTSLLGTTAQILSLHSVSPEKVPPVIAKKPPTPGTALLHKLGKERRVFVACAKETWLEVQQVKMAGKKEAGVKDWWNGLPKEIRESGILVFE